MMYGEQYAIEARAERRGGNSGPIRTQTAKESEVPRPVTLTANTASDKSEPQQEPHPKKGGYAAALLSTPSPPSQAASTLATAQAGHIKAKNSKAAKYDKKRAAKEKRSEENPCA